VQAPTGADFFSLPDSDTNIGKITARIVTANITGKKIIHVSSKQIKIYKINTLAPVEQMQILNEYHLLRQSKQEFIKVVLCSTTANKIS
jgi:hypothetical protein